MGLAETFHALLTLPGLLVNGFSLFCFEIRVLLCFVRAPKKLKRSSCPSFLYSWDYRCVATLCWFFSGRKSHNPRHEGTEAGCSCHSAGTSIQTDTESRNVTGYQPPSPSHVKGVSQWEPISQHSSPKLVIPEQGAVEWRGGKRPRG